MTKPVEVNPRDEHNLAWVANVHPSDWKNPVPSGPYNLVVIGGGTAGLITAAVAAGLGARVALVERHMLGGDCLNVGCVPSKALIRSGRMAHEARATSKQLDLPIPGDWRPDFGAAMRRLREIRARISEDDSAQRYTEELGVDVYLGNARFTGDRRIEIDGTELRFAKAVIATGARATGIPIPGLEEAGYLTNENLFDLTERPERLAVIGAGPIGCEMAQAFRRLGSEVAILERADQILTREDPDAAAIVQQAFVREGIDLVFGCNVERVERRGAEKVLHLSCPEKGARELVVDEVLVGIGRTPNVDGLGLETVGVDFDPREGVTVDDQLRTSNKRIFAAGDVCMQWKFTHAADAAAKIVVQNALFGRRLTLSSLVMPWCTYTDPEVAHVGLYGHEADEQGIEIETFDVPLERVNRAVADGEEEGFVRIHVKKGSDRIVGATIVASHAGEMLSEVTTAMVGGLGLKTLASVIHPYPTQAEGIKAASGAWLRTRLTPTVAKIFRLWMSATR